MMSKNHVKMLKNLDKVLFDDGGETPAEVRQRLEMEGVDVKALVARVKGAAGEAYRQHLTAKAKSAQAEAAKSKGKVFGDLVGIGREKLLELIHAAARGDYGGVVMARCRNQNPEALSDEDLRTLLEDIESTTQK
jgi:hypothetical protein